MTPDSPAKRLLVQIARRDEPVNDRSSPATADDGDVHEFIGRTDLAGVIERPRRPAESPIT